MFYYLDKNKLIERCEPVVITESYYKLESLLNDSTACYESDNGLPRYLTIDSNDNVVIPSDMELYEKGIINIDDTDYVDQNGNIRRR